jgi:hypothetical protein
MSLDKKDDDLYQIPNSEFKPTSFLLDNEHLIKNKPIKQTISENGYLHFHFDDDSIFTIKSDLKIFVDEPFNYSIPIEKLNMDLLLIHHISKIIISIYGQITLHVYKHNIPYSDDDDMTELELKEERESEKQIIFYHNGITNIRYKNKFMDFIPNPEGHSYCNLGFATKYEFINNLHKIYLDDGTYIVFNGSMQCNVWFRDDTKNICGEEIAINKRIHNGNEEIQINNAGMILIRYSKNTQLRHYKGG